MTPEKERTAARRYTIPAARRRWRYCYRPAEVMTSRRITGMAKNSSRHLSREHVSDPAAPPKGDIRSRRAECSDLRSEPDEKTATEYRKGGPPRYGPPRARYNDPMMRMKKR
jgi:hypothetical protein